MQGHRTLKDMSHYKFYKDKYVAIELVDDQIQFTTKQTRGTYIFKVPKDKESVVLIRNNIRFEIYVDVILHALEHNLDPIILSMALNNYAINARKRLTVDRARVYNAVTTTTPTYADDMILYQMTQHIEPNLHVPREERLNKLIGDSGENELSN